MQLVSTLWKRVNFYFRVWANKFHHPKRCTIADYTRTPRSNYHLRWRWRTSNKSRPQFFQVLSLRDLSLHRLTERRIRERVRTVTKNNKMDQTRMAQIGLPAVTDPTSCFRPITLRGFTVKQRSSITSRNILYFPEFNLQGMMISWGYVARHKYRDGFMIYSSVDISHRIRNSSVFVNTFRSCIAFEEAFYFSQKETKLQVSCTDMYELVTFDEFWTRNYHAL